MLGKKLLTLACAIGILACGACFVPALIDDAHRPPPPPLNLDLRGIHRIDVIATDASQLKKLDARSLADIMAIEINSVSRDTRVRAHYQGDTKPPDGTLQVTVLEEKAMLTPVKDMAPMVNWTLVIRIAASLKNRAGQELWSQSGREYAFSGRMSTQDATKFWKTDAAQSSMFFRLCPKIVHSMFYGGPNDH